MRDLSFRNLISVNKAQIIDTFNLAFSDYIIPIRFTAEQFDAKIQLEKIDLNYSLGAFANNELVGFVLHGALNTNHKLHLYNAGTGVVPNYRGQKITKKLYQFGFENIFHHQVDDVLLEVITSNKPAIATYKGIGFNCVEHYQCYRIDVKNFKPHYLPEHINIQPIAHIDWTFWETQHEIACCWQNHSNVLNESASLLNIYGAYIHDHLVGYVIYNPISNRIHQFAVHKDFRRQKIASSLFTYLIARYNHPISIINIPLKAEGIHNFLKNINAQPTLQQYSMLYQPLH